MHWVKPSTWMLGAVTLVMVSSWLSIELTRETGRIATIWLTNGLLLALVMKQPRSHWPSLLIAGWSGNVLANILAGDAIPVALGLSIANSVEVGIVCLTHTVVGGGQDFRRPRFLIAFFAASVGPACLASALVAAVVLSQFGPAPFGDTFFAWYAADVLGLVTITPLIMLTTAEELVELRHKSQRPRVLGASAILGVVLAAVFVQNTLPLLFLVFPAVLIAPFVLGAPGALLAIFATLVAGIWATSTGHGPIALVNASLRGQFFVLQLFIASVAITCLMVASFRTQREFLSAAFLQGPDFQYVKDRQGRFVAVNENVAANARLEPRRLIGKTDFDIAPASRAEALFEAEQRLMKGESLARSVIEKVEGQNGRQIWFETTKSAVLNRAGRVIGLSGVTRDVTAERARHDQLESVLSQMADGVALFDLECRFVFCNEQYHRMFPLTRDVRVPGAALADVLRMAVERGEQHPLNTQSTEAWVNQVITGIRSSSDEEVKLSDGSVRAIRNREIESLGFVSVVSDITAMRRAEADLRVMTEQLRLLASTDGLTGLKNRRSFDDTLEREIARCSRVQAPISLVLFDIDRFKAFNDHYGHPSGDECLKRVADVLRRSARRPADTVARYGGEEFAIVLPDTDEDGAYFLADEARISVRALALEHELSDKSIVTVSAGVACLRPDDTDRNALHLIQQADEALYIAKGAGRDRVMGWSSRHAVRMQVGA